MSLLSEEESDIQEIVLFRFSVPSVARRVAKEKSSSVQLTRALPVLQVLAPLASTAILVSGTF